MADFKRSGFLDLDAFCKAMDLISMAQGGKVRAPLSHPLAVLLAALLACVGVSPAGPL